MLFVFYLVVVFFLLTFWLARLAFAYSFLLYVWHGMVWVGKWHEIRRTHTQRILCGVLTVESRQMQSIKSLRESSKSYELCVILNAHTHAHHYPKQ